MLPFEFFAQNLHFALSLFAALVFFAVFWLYFDAWVSDRDKRLRDVPKWAGFLFITASFVVYATIIEQSSFGQSIFGNAGSLLSTALRLIGYLIIIIGQLIDPLQEKPKNLGLEAEFGQDNGGQTNGIIASSSGYGTVLALPVGAFTVAALYWRRATTGLERHLKPVAFAFLALFGFELLGLVGLLRSTADPNVFNLVKAFGPVWLASHACLFVAALILGQWVWKYLTERFLSQLFMTFTSTILVIFLVTTISFTFLLLRSIQNDALNNLETAANVLGYALDSKKAETSADASAIAANPAVVAAITAKDHKTLDSLTATFLESKKQSSLVITTADAQVLLRAEDPDHWGDSVSSDTLVRRALIGTASSTVASQDSVLAPVVSIRSVVPVRDSSSAIVGTISDAVVIDNAFVDGIKHATGLDSAIYSGNVRSATTFTTADGTSRWIGIKETNGDVQSTVLKDGKTFKGLLQVLNRQYLAVYTPLKDADNTIVGMLFIGQPEVSILATAAYLINLTFIGSVILLVIAIIPAYFVARHIARQLD